jgi:hypothetical protein
MNAEQTFSARVEQRLREVHAAEHAAIIRIAAHAQLPLQSLGLAFEASEDSIILRDEAGRRFTLRACLISDL